MKQFDIWLADLNPGRGTEPGKIRPVLIVQNNFVIQEGHKSTIVCPLTTNLTNDARILRIRLNRDQTDILQDSDILIDQIRAINNKRFMRYIGRLDEATLAQVKESLGYILDLE